MADLSERVSDVIEADSREIIFEKFKTLLDAVKDPESIKDIPNLLIHDFRDLSVEEASVVGELLKVKTIKDLAKITYGQVLDRIALLTEAAQIPKTKIEQLITAAKYIVKAADHKPIEGKKVVIAGLDNAGKTALLKSIGKEVGFTQLSTLKPTKGANRGEMFLQDQDILILELGGQEKFRKFYIEQPDRFFLETAIIVYLIDMQDDARYPDTLEYLQQILRTLDYLLESPDFIILFHKCDPDVSKSPLFQEKLDYMDAKIQEAFKPYKFQFEIQTSSIFNIVSMTPSFSRMLKGLFSGVAMEDEKKIQAIGELLVRVVDSFLSTENTLTRQVNYLKSKIDELESKIASGTVAAGKSGAAPSTTATPSTALKAPSPKPKPSGPRGGMSTRSALLSELKQVFGLRGKAM